MNSSFFIAIIVLCIFELVIDYYVESNIRINLLVIITLSTLGLLL